MSSLFCGSLSQVALLNNRSKFEGKFPRKELEWFLHLLASKLLFCFVYQLFLYRLIKWWTWNKYFRVRKKSNVLTITWICFLAVCASDRGTLLWGGREKGTGDCWCLQVNKIKMSRKPFDNFFTLKPLRDWLLISPYSIRIESNIKGMRQKEIITNLRSFWWLLNKFSLLAP